MSHSRYIKVTKWMAGRKERMERKRIHKLQLEERLEQLHRRGSFTDKARIAQIKADTAPGPDTPKIDCFIKTLEPNPPLQPQPPPLFYKWLYYFLTALFIFPGYFYKKHYEENYQKYLAQKKQIQVKEQKAPQNKPKPIDDPSKGPISAEEFKKIYARAGFSPPDSPTVESKPDIEEKAPPSESLFSCLDCFFHKSHHTSVTKSESINLKSRLRRS